MPSGFGYSDSQNFEQGNLTIAYTTRNEFYRKTQANAFKRTHLLDGIMTDSCAWQWASRGHSDAGGRIGPMMPRCQSLMQCRTAHAGDVQSTRASLVPKIRWYDVLRQRTGYYVILVCFRPSEGLISRAEGCFKDTFSLECTAIFMCTAHPKIGCRVTGFPCQLRVFDATSRSQRTGRVPGDSPSKAPRGVSGGDLEKN